MAQEFVFDLSVVIMRVYCFWFVFEVKLRIYFLIGFSHEDVFLHNAFNIFLSLSALYYIRVLFDLTWR